MANISFILGIFLYILLLRLFVVTWINLRNVILILYSNTIIITHLMHQLVLPIDAFSMEYERTNLDVLFLKKVYCFIKYVFK